MILSEKLYTLRKQSALSQEQLAELLDVSRQAVSKWETGQSVPDTDKLIALSDYYHISLDDLLKGDALPQSNAVQPEAAPEPTAPEAPPAEQEQPEPPKQADRIAVLIGRVLGLFFCIGGMAALIIHAVLFFFYPAQYQQSGGSSMIMLDGNAVFMLIGAAAIILGAVLFVRASKT